MFRSLNEVKKYLFKNDFRLLYRYLCKQTYVVCKFVNLFQLPDLKGFSAVFTTSFGPPPSGCESVAYYLELYRRQYTGQILLYRSENPSLLIKMSKSSKRIGIIIESVRVFLVLVFRCKPAKSAPLIPSDKICKG